MKFTVDSLINKLNNGIAERYLETSIVIEVDGKDYYFDIVEGHNKVRLVVTDPA
jgi:hypothetical protein